MNSKSKSKKKNDFAYIVPAVDRAAQILSLLKEKGRSMTIAEVTEATQWHKSSVHKILVTLNYHGLLDRDENTKQYSLGIALIGYGQFVMNHLDIRHEVSSLLKELSDFSGETANFSIINGKHVIITQSVESQGDLRVVPPIGTMDPLTRKSNGKVILAALPENHVVNLVQQEGLPAFTEKSITTLQDFKKELETVRAKGYATDFEEFQEGIHAVSAPVFNADNQVIGSLTIVGPSFRMKKERMHLYGEECIKKAKRVSELFRLLPQKTYGSDVANYLKPDGLRF